MNVNEQSRLNVNKKGVKTASHVEVWWLLSSTSYKLQGLEFQVLVFIFKSEIRILCKICWLSPHNILFWNNFKTYVCISGEIMQWVLHTLLDFGFISSIAHVHTHLHTHTYTHFFDWIISLSMQHEYRHSSVATWFPWHLKKVKKADVPQYHVWLFP